MIRFSLEEEVMEQGGVVPALGRLWRRWRILATGGGKGHVDSSTKGTVTANARLELAKQNIS